MMDCNTGARGSVCVADYNTYTFNENKNASLISVQF